jgi:hypothetical protein
MGTVCWAQSSARSFESPPEADWTAPRRWSSHRLWPSRTEAFGVRCEIHTTIYHPLELVNLHCCAAVQNCSHLELLVPEGYFQFGLKEPIRIEGGMSVPPKDGRRWTSRGPASNPLRRTIHLSAITALEECS